VVRACGAVVEAGEYLLGVAALRSPAPLRTLVPGTMNKHHAGNCLSPVRRQRSRGLES
jgi:hypothetical protein